MVEDDPGIVDEVTGDGCLLDRRVRWLRFCFDVFALVSLAVDDSEPSEAATR
jgi:hypothetical protein